MSRDTGKDALNTVLKNEKNINVLEKSAFEKSGGEEDLYYELIFGIIMDIKNGKKLQDILKSFKDDKYMWNREEFEETKYRQREQDDFIVNPFEVEEGVLTCTKCGNSRTFSYTKQTRSADEPMTTFATCMTCKNKWTYSG
jgi:DNA-directed RNA polymerase subunit M/transcription elongation factor TFIIS